VASAAIGVRACSDEPTGGDTPRLLGTYALASIDHLPPRARFDPGADPNSRTHAGAFALVPGSAYSVEVARDSAPRRPTRRR
jgi:hypothetical protein